MEKGIVRGSDVFHIAAVVCGTLICGSAATEFATRQTKCPSTAAMKCSIERYKQATRQTKRPSSAASTTICDGSSSHRVDCGLKVRIDRLPPCPRTSLLLRRSIQGTEFVSLALT